MNRVAAAKKAATVLLALRKRRPLVHCITNDVAMPAAANAVLAVGATPVMAHAPEESGAVAGQADSLTINVGTLTPARLAGIHQAVETANRRGLPWVLDPVAHHVSPWRGEAVRRLLDCAPAVLRANGAEILSLTGQAPSAHGPDARQDEVIPAPTTLTTPTTPATPAAGAAAQSLAQRYGLTVGASAPVDTVSDGRRMLHIGGGDAQMARVSATGCALTCVIGAFLAVADPFDATLAAFALFAVAGQQAGRDCSGPGSFAPAFLDRLAAMEPETLQRAAAAMIAESQTTGEGREVRSEGDPSC